MTAFTVEQKSQLAKLMATENLTIQHSKIHTAKFDTKNRILYLPIWHQEIEDILVLKNNKGTEDNRVRKLDYSIQISKLFYERFIKNEEVSLFSPHAVPGLYDAFGTDSWHHRNGYQHSPKAVEGFVHHPVHGQVARLTHIF